jgi:archaellum component FlaC
VILPEDTQTDVLSSLENRVEELETKLEEETSEKINLSNELIESLTQNIFAEATNGLAETQIEKLRALSEGLDYENVEDFSNKLNTLKESYLETKKATTSDISDESPVDLAEENEAKPLGEMAKYADAITRTVRK